MTTFSVIIPCYNCAESIGETIASVQRQSDKDWELIAVDDGSTDETACRLAAIADADARIRVLRQPNSGPSAARNLGMLYAHGDYLAFLDADDRWKTNKLTAHRAFFEANPLVDAAFAQVRFFDTQPGDANGASRIPAKPLTLRDMTISNHVCTMSNLVIRRSVIRRAGLLEPDMVYGEDRKWLIDMLLAGCRIQGLTRHLVWYRNSPDGLSANLAAMHEGWRRSVAPIRASRRMTEACLRQAEAAYLRYLARRALRLKTPEPVAWRYLNDAIRCSPCGYFAAPSAALLTMLFAFRSMIAFQLRQMALYTRLQHHPSRP